MDAHEPPSHTSHGRTDVTIEVSTTDRRDGKALALFARWQDWQQGHTKDGRSFFAIPGSEPGLFHMADQNDCSCPDRQRSRNVCKHMRAVRLWMAAYATGAVAPKPRPATPDVVDDAGNGDELVILTPKGAAFLAAEYGESEPAPASGETTAPTDPFDGWGTEDPAPERSIPDPDELREQIARMIREQDTYRRGLLATGTRPVEDGLWRKRDEIIHRLRTKLPQPTFR